MPQTQESLNLTAVDAGLATPEGPLVRSLRPARAVLAGRRGRERRNLELRLRCLGVSVLLHLFFAWAALSLAGLQSYERTPRARPARLLVARLEVPEVWVEPAEPEPEVVEEELPPEEPEVVEQEYQEEPVREEPPPEKEALDWLPPENLFEDLPDEPLNPPRPEPEVVPEPPVEPLPPVEGPEEAPVEEEPAEAPPGEEEGEPPILSAPAPAYPKLAERLGQQGTVVVRITIDAEGRLVSCEVVESSGHPLLDEAAVEGVSRWTFRPRITGEPDLRRYRKPIRFRLFDGDDESW